MQKKKSSIYFITIFLGAVVLIFLSNFLKGKWDLTEEKRYTLSEATTHLVNEINKPIKIEVFLTGDLPPNYQRLQAATENLLSDFADISHQQIQYSFVTPGQDLADSQKMALYDSLARLGVAFENTEQISTDKNAQKSQLIIPSAIVYAEGKRPIPIDLRSSRTIFKPYNIVNDNPEPDKEATLNAAEALLEYKFANAIQLATRTTAPKIAYLVGNGEPTDLSINDLGETIRKDYDLGVLDLKQSFPTPQTIQALLIVKPTKAFTDEDKLKLDQYVMHGGKIIWFIDKLYAEIDSIMRKQADFVAFDRNLNLDDILFKYGVRINDNLIQDLNCAKLPIVVGYNPDNSPKIQRMPWPYYPFLSATNDNPISRNMDRVLSTFPESIDTIANPEVKKTILLATDTNSRVISSPALVSLNSWQDDPDFRSFNKAHIPVAVLLEGRFPSLFANRLPQTTIDSLQNHISAPFLTNSQPTQQIIVSNAGIVTNSVSQTSGPLPMGSLPFDNYRFANRDFLKNSLDYLTGNAAIFEAKNKDFILRLLDTQKVENQKTFWQAINVLLPIIILIIFGVGFYYFRKNKYQSKQ